MTERKRNKDRNKDTNEKKEKKRKEKKRKEKKRKEKKKPQNTQVFLPKRYSRQPSLPRTQTSLEKFGYRPKWAYPCLAVYSIKSKLA